MNPFLQWGEPKAWGPGSFEMALPLVEALKIRAGMRILEIGGGSGQVAAVLAKHWNVTIVTLEPWTDGQEIQQYADNLGVSNQVLSMKLKAQQMPFANETFDAIFSVGSFEMIGDERSAALNETVRVAKAAPLSALPNRCVNQARCLSCWSRSTESSTWASKGALEAQIGMVSFLSGMGFLLCKAVIFHQRVLGGWLTGIRNGYLRRSSS